MKDDARRLVQTLEALQALTEEQAKTNTSTTPPPGQTEELIIRFTANLERILGDTERARQREFVLLDISDCLMRLYAHRRAQPACEHIASLMRDWRLLRVTPISTGLNMMRRRLENEQDLHEMRRIITELREMQRLTHEDLKAASDGLTSQQLILLSEALATARTLLA